MRSPDAERGHSPIGASEILPSGEFRRVFVKNQAGTVPLWVLSGEFQAPEGVLQLPLTQCLASKAKKSGIRGLIRTENRDGVPLFVPKFAFSGEGSSLQRCQFLLTAPFRFCDFLPQNAAQLMKTAPRVILTRYTRPGAFFQRGEGDIRSAGMRFAPAAESCPRLLLAVADRRRGLCQHQGAGGSHRN